MREGILRGKKNKTKQNKKPKIKNKEENSEGGKDGV